MVAATEKKPKKKKDEKEEVVESSKSSPRATFDRARAKTKPLGDAGLNYFANNLQRSQEHLVELQGREGSVRYRQMSRGDAQVGMILKVHKNPIRSANWSFDAPDDASPEEENACNILNEWFFSDSRHDFDTLLGQILSCLEYGFSCFEIIYEVYEYEGKKYLVPRLEQRMQTSIENIYPDKGFIQQATVTEGLVDIPIEDLVFFILNQQGEDMRGESVLRTAYPAWKDKKTYEQWQGMGIQRSAGGIMKGKVPKGTRPDSQEYVDFIALLEGVTAHENAYVVYPDGYEVEMMKSEFNAEQVQKAIDAKNSEMAMSVLAQFILLGQSGRGGSFALSRDQSDFFLDGLQYVINLIERSFHRQVINAFIDINFGSSINSTRINLKGVDLNKKVGDELSDVLSKLHNTGFIKATVNDEIFIRRCLRMPELDEQEVEQRQDAIDNPPPPPVPPGAPPVDPDKPEPAPDKPVKLSESVTKRRKSRQEYIERTSKEVYDFMKGNLLFIKDKLLADIESVLKSGSVEINGLRRIEVGTTKYRENLERKLAGIAMEAWNNAKAQSKEASVKLADRPASDVKSKNLKAFLLNEATSIAEQQGSTMKNRAILTASNGPLKGLSISQTISNVDRVLEDFIDSGGVQVAGSLVVVGTTNFGEFEYYKQIEDQLWGYRFVGVDDDRQTEICGWYSGKTYSVNSPELAMVSPPLHSNCRSYLEPIYKSEAEPETIDNELAPPSIRKQQNIL